ncbi:hypothetical protein [Actinomadura sp. KC06]|uniref:hypothetical protein n=1 Tax=Actinomadura sp. KC06 TaxID=2530369 RepID=UPI00140528D9|nr:hypothetical protein [Actinomadura sp. KC06]
MEKTELVFKCWTVTVVTLGVVIGFVVYRDPISDALQRVTMIDAKGVRIELA